MYFNFCLTRSEAQALYRSLAKQHHPDRGGDGATMAAINAEYDEWQAPAIRVVHFKPEPQPKKAKPQPVGESRIGNALKHNLRCGRMR